MIFCTSLWFTARTSMIMSAASASSLQPRKSAHGRLQSSSLVPETNSQRGAGINEEFKAKVKSRRVKSARETRMEQEASDIFPPVSPFTKNDKWGTTQYGDDFGKKQAFTPVPVRPVSPTRRNNPHPSKPFLQWKHPVRIHTHKKAVSPPEEAWKYISEGFYDDYTDTHNTGDAKNEVPVTNLAKIEFPGKNETQHLVSGTKVQLNPRSCWVHKGHQQHTSSSVIRPPSPKSRMIHNTVRGNSLPAIREWLKTASSKERELVLQMLTAAHIDSEDTRLKKAVDEVLRPDSAGRVQKWLESATDSERKTLLNVLETLAVASENTTTHQSPPHLILPPANWHQQTTSNHYRSNSYPISLRPRICHHHKGHTHSHNRAHYSRHDHKHHNHTSTHHHHHHKTHHCHKAHQHSSHKSVGNDCQNTGDMTLVGKKMGLKSQMTPELWHHKIPPTSTKELLVIHPGSVFGQPHKDRGRHYAIHPEWPTA